MMRKVLDKYSIAESIKDGTTVLLNYSLVSNDLNIKVPKALLDSEFLSLTETQGVSDIRELNRLLDRSVKLKTFLKSADRIKKVTDYIIDHFQNNVEPLGFKAFVVAVDRQACALYKTDVPLNHNDNVLSNMLQSSSPSSPNANQGMDVMTLKQQQPEQLPQSYNPEQQEQQQYPPIDNQPQQQPLTTMSSSPSLLLSSPSSASPNQLFQSNIDSRYDQGLNQMTTN